VLLAPLELHDLRIQRRDKLSKDDDARAWVTAWSKYAATAGPVDTFYWNNAPYAFGGFGIEGAIHCLYPRDQYRIRSYDRPPLPVDGGRVTVLTWNSGLHKVDIVEHGPTTPDASYIDTNVGTPVWQLGEGWSNPEGGYRWIAPLATVRLDRPAGAVHFELRVLANTGLMQSAGTVRVQVSLNDAELARKIITQPGWQVLQWDLPAAPAGSTPVTIRTDPPLRPPGDPRTLGIAVGSLGFR
jgi:hypothetical protein